MELVRIINFILRSAWRMNYILLTLLGYACIVISVFESACVLADCKNVVSTPTYNYDETLPRPWTVKSYSTTSSSLQLQTFREYASEETMANDKLSNSSENARSKYVHVSDEHLTLNKGVTGEVDVNDEKNSLTVKEKDKADKVRKGDPEDYFYTIGDNIPVEGIRCNTIVPGDSLTCMQFVLIKHLNDLLQMDTLNLSEYAQIIVNPQGTQEYSLQKRPIERSFDSQLWNLLGRFIKSHTLRVRVPELFGVVPGFVSTVRVRKGRVEIGFESLEDSQFEGRFHKDKDKKKKKTKDKKVMVTVMMMMGGMMMKAAMMGAVLIAKKALMVSMMALAISTMIAWKKAKKGDAHSSYRRQSHLVTDPIHYEPHVYLRNVEHVPKFTPSVTMYSGFHPMVTQKPVGYRSVVKESEQTDWLPIESPYTIGK